MENDETDIRLPSEIENENTKGIESSENFQKYITELFEKNGILNDLRAYLRGHIVDLLKNAQTGSPPACQRHFTQRLELTFQALNIIIAEYLLCLEFSYTLSVFISEIPLANMVFQFAKILMKQNSVEGDSTRLRFDDRDVWSVLNYLGVKCDSDHASNIIEMYKREEQSPLLLCILKCMPMYHKQPAYEQVNASEESLSSSAKSSDTLEDQNVKSKRRNLSYDKCKHCMFCKTCQNRIDKLRDKYKEKKKSFAKMFQQLKNVYETEVQMVKEEEERKIKRSLASHALQLQKKRDELEQSFEARERQLELRMQQKKQFLWELARALRLQHAHLARAMAAVRQETDRLTDKEKSLKTQLFEAEEVLRKRGEEMRAQISNELVILEQHLESMKRERDSINEERTELENLKTMYNKNSSDIKKHNTVNNEDLKSHYDLLKNEFSILKKYLESTKLEPKCVIERSTLTELNDITAKLNVILNNGQGFDKDNTREGERTNKTPNQVVNNLKKQKNVNFSQANLDEVYRERSRERSRSSASSEAGDAAIVGRLDRDWGRDHEYNRDHDRNMIQRLRDENERLRTFARQQSEHIDVLCSQQARLQAELTATRCTSAVPTPVPRPRTAPPYSFPYTHPTGHNVTSSASASGWVKGAGEELSLFTNAQPTVLVPGDTLPFVGVLAGRRTDSKRRFINQWRTLRQHTPPSRPVEEPGAASMSFHNRNVEITSGTTEPKAFPVTDTTYVQDHSANNLPNPDIFNAHENVHQRPRTPVTADSKSRDKSPKSVLREAKEKLKSKNRTVEQPSSTSREKSPNSVLREAKLRLRKLEIEAEAVEKSYLDFRKRRSQRDESKGGVSEETVVIKDVIKDIDLKREKSLQKLNEKYENEREHLNIRESQNSMKTDFEKYLKDYQMKYNIGETYFKNKNTVSEIVKPIPKAYSNVNNEINNNKLDGNYLETPLTEFRRFYHSEKSYRTCKTIDNEAEKSQHTSHVNVEKTDIDLVIDQNSKTEVFINRRDSIKIAKNDTKAEFEILKNNISKIYNLKEAPIKSEASIIEEKEIRENISQAITAEFQISESNINNLDETPVKLPDTPIIEEKENKEVSKEFVEQIDTNILRIEIESVNETNNIKLPEAKKPNDELLLVVESAIDTGELNTSESDARDQIPTQMTIIVSPKRNNEYDIDKKCETREEIKRALLKDEVKLSKNDVLDDIFQADANKDLSSIEMQIQLSKDMDDSNSGHFENGRDEYADDFSADVDNYYSRSDYENENNSPISLPKTSEDENFWDS